MKLGAHTSIAGGLHRAIERSEVFSGTALQIFSKNNNQWVGRELTEEMCGQWHDAAGGCPIPLEDMAIHDSYLINLCSPDPVTFGRSFDAFVDEHQRAERLGIRLLNFHPGAAMSRDRESAIAIIVEQVNRAHEATAGSRTISVLEATAGQGTTIGYRFEELGAIMRGIDDRDRVAVCIDTCHIFAAGYDISTERGYLETFEELDAIVGLENVRLFHLNDSKRECGSRVDRHEHIGRGLIGETPFRMLMADERFTHVPMVIETPKSADLHEDVENLELLRSWIPVEASTVE